MHSGTAVTLAVLLSFAAGAQQFKPGPQVLTFLSDIDDTDQPYALYLPKDFSPAKKYPLVISLHGADSNHRLNLRRVFGRGNASGEQDAQASRYFPALRDVDYIVASPLARGTMGYQGIPEKDVYDVLADVKKRFPIDEDRVYLTGLSMGGGGALWLGLTRPDIWAAIAPVCPAVPPGTDDLAANALNTAVHLFHGEDDPVVNVQVSRDWTRHLRDNGVKVEYTEYPHVRHNSWDYAYKDGAIFDWFGQFRRNRFPDRVRFVSAQYKYDTAYWVQIDELTPGTLASIDARFTAPNRIEVTTSGLGAFTLRIAAHPKFAQNRPVRVLVDGKSITVHPQPVLSFTRRTVGWVPAHYLGRTGSKRRGAEGPLAEAVDGPQIYVYGTLDNPPAIELQERREIATHAADYSSTRSRLALTPRVAADSDIGQNDAATSNLILFGTKETNSLIAKYSAELPIQLNAGAADYGLFYVFPAGPHYIVINSGLPWWTGIEYVHRPMLPFVPPRYGTLLSFPDYLLFKGSLEHIVIEARFDREWRITPADAAKLHGSGVIKLNQ